MKPAADRAQGGHPRQTLGVLVVGAGDLGARHAQHWRSVGARVVAVTDPDLGRAQRVALEVGAEANVEAERYLTRADVDVVSVCTPTHLHERYTVAALNAKKHVLTEKPVALTLPAAERMKAAAATNGKELRVGFMRRFDPAHEELTRRHALMRGPTFAQARISAGVRPKVLMHDANANGGPVIDMACHLFDQWRELFGGHPVSVTAHGRTLALERPELRSVKQKALDTALFTLTYPHGNVGQVLLSWGLPPGVPYAEQHTYVNENGLLSVNWNESLTQVSSAEGERWLAPEVDAWRRQIEQFYAELTEGAPQIVASVDDGIAALRVSLAVLQAVEEGRTIHLGEGDGSAPQRRELRR